MEIEDIEIGSYWKTVESGRMIRVTDLDDPSLVGFKHLNDKFQNHRTVHFSIFRKQFEQVDKIEVVKMRLRGEM